MAPQTPVHALHTLESHLNLLPNGKPRNPPVRLADCALKELVQYKCNIELEETTRTPVVICEPVVRLLRQCEGGLSVETTAWEGCKVGQGRTVGV